MTPLTIALYLTCLFLGTSAQNNLTPSNNVRQEKTFYSVNVGESVTLQCYYEDDAVMFYWYKQTLGQKPKLISTFYQHKNGTFHNEFKNDSRFTLDTKDSKNLLTISNLRVSDSATYYCIGSYAFQFEFADGIVVSVKGSGLSIRASVHQLESENTQPGDSVTLSCTVHTGTCDDGENSVHWFKNSQESHSGIIYTHGGRIDQCERSNNTQTHTCVYNLPMKSLNPSHVGIDCAIASCGQILFGNKRKLGVSNEVDSFVLVYILSGALAFSIILIVFLAYAAYAMKRKLCQCTASADSTPYPESYRDADDLHYAALRQNKVSRSRRQRDDTLIECVYSGVKL